jgi:selenide,water dikinase
MLSKLKGSDSLALIINNYEDAGIFRIDNRIQIVQSIDVITPVTDDPWTLGAIATAHALSDLYSMGARPLTGLLFLGLPVLQVSTDTASKILQGAIDKLAEATASMLGGHTMSSKELQVGLAVTGTIEGCPITNTGCQEGDILILTKPLGSGIIVTAQKFYNAEIPIEDFSKEIVEDCQKSMLELNSTAAEVMLATGVHACTDVTGFGLIGHLMEMLSTSRYSAEISASAIPVMSGVLKLASQDIASAGCDRNMTFWWNDCEFFAKSITHVRKMILFDPQTSGGLLISVAENKAQELLDNLKHAGVEHSSIIGQINRRGNAKVIVKD